MWKRAADPDGDGDAAGDGGDALGDEATADGLAARDVIGRRDGEDRSRPRAQEQESTEDQRRDGDAGHEAGDDRQTGPHGRERTSTSGSRRAPETRCYHAGPMSGLAERARTRFVPALLTALGVTMLAAGLLNYTTPVTAESLPTDSPDASAALASPAPLITLPPLASVGPSASPSVPADRVATRVRVAALKIDLPVVKPGKPTDYPLCNVAQWIGALGQPGEGRATYLYAHARTGMFLPLLDASLTKKGRAKLRGWSSRSGPATTSASCTRSSTSVNTSSTWMTP